MAVKRPTVAKTSTKEEPASTGNISTKHPLYVDILPDYEKVRDCAVGSRAIKRAGKDYLPMPDGFNAQTDGGTSMYEAYKLRAEFPEMYSPTIMGMVGVLHRREAEITGLTGELAYLWENATQDGLTLETLHRKISEEILTTGRIGIFADAPPADVGGGNPYLSLYNAESIINWSDNGDFYVLEENVRTRSGFNWDVSKQYRVIQKTATGYKVAIFDASTMELDETKFAMLTAKGGEVLVTAPFVIAGSRGIGVEPDVLPLIGVANSSLAMYRLDADYRHQLFMSGQETLVFAGIDAKDLPTHVGAGVAVALPTGGTAVYASPKGTGMAAHRVAINDERENAAAAGARVMDTAQRGAESGDALKIRARASTASLLTIALSAGAALERSLRQIAVQMKVDPATIIVKPNLDFLDTPLTTADALNLIKSWQARAISYKTLYANLVKAEIGSPDRTDVEEQQLIASETYLTDAEEREKELNTPPEPVVTPPAS